MNNVSPFIRLREVEILWTHSDDGLVNWVGVFRNFCDPDDIWFDCSSGCSFSEWGKGDPCLTPEGTYIVLESTGFADDDVRLATLRQFAQIEGCEWARVMAAALEQFRG